MEDLIGKKIHQFGSRWYEEIVEIVRHTDDMLLVKIRADDGFEMYEGFEKKNGEWDFSSYWHHSNRETALYLFEYDLRQKSA